MQAWQGSALHTHYVEGLTCVRLTGGAAGFVCGAGGLRSSIERTSAGGRQRRKDGSILKWHWRKDRDKITRKKELDKQALSRIKHEYLSIWLSVLSTNPSSTGLKVNATQSLTFFPNNYCQLRGCKL